MPRPDRGGLSRDWKTPAGGMTGVEGGLSAAGIADLCRDSLVPMVQAAANRERDQPARSVNWLGLLMVDRRVTVQPLVRTSNVVVIVDELIEQPLEMALVQHDDVVEKLAAQGSDKSLDEWIPPWTPEPRANFLDSAVVKESVNSLAVDPVVAPEHVTRLLSEGHGLP